MGYPAYPSGEQSAHRRSGKPAAPAHRQANPGGPVLPRREAGGTTRGAVCRIRGTGTLQLSAVSFQLSAISYQFTAIRIPAVSPSFPQRRRGTRGLEMGRPLSGVIRRSSKKRVLCRGSRSGGADEDAMGVGHTRRANSRLTGAAANPQRRHLVRQTPEDPFCHAAKREAQLEVACAASNGAPEAAASAKPSVSAVSYQFPVASFQRSARDTAPRVGPSLSAACSTSALERVCKART